MPKSRTPTHTAEANTGPRLFARDDSARSSRERFAGPACLLTFLFHGIFRNRNEVDRGVVDPQQAVTLDHFRRYVEFYLRQGYRFISPDDLAGPLEPGQYVMTTFDDGYFNNALVQPLLCEYGIPATFFISTNHVKQQKCYWWDVVYRELRGRGETKAAISREQGMLKEKTHEVIESRLAATFGASALEPREEIDRPFRPDELAEFAKLDFVHLGNHTSDHAILTNYDFAGALRQMAAAQRDLEAICGVAPDMISYPNGNYSTEVIRAARQAGLTSGISVEKRPNHLPRDLEDDQIMRLGRFTLWGTDTIERQCEHFQSIGRWRRWLGLNWLRRRAA